VKKWVKGFRKLAKQHEDGSYMGSMTHYTCNHVGMHISLKARRAYEGAFGFARPTLAVTKSESDLWNMSEVRRHNVRILMLCFAAAMAERGDL
jgi:hypothetical protein